MGILFLGVVGISHTNPQENIQLNILPSAFAQSVEAGVESEVKVGVGSGDDEKEDEEKQPSKQSETSAESETRIKVSIENGVSEIEINHKGEVESYTLETDSKSEIIASIEARTGLGESEIRSIWEVEMDGERKDKSSEMKVKAETKGKAQVEIQREKAEERSIEIIAKLKQRIEALEQRLQSLMVKLESGAYFGTIPDEKPIKSETASSFSLTFEGEAVTVSEMRATGKQITDATFDSAEKTKMSGKIFVKTIAERENQSKFKVEGGTIVVGESTHDIMFGKARASGGFSGEKDTMIVIAHTTDSMGTPHTVKLMLKSESSFEGNLAESGSMPVEILSPQSKIAGKAFLKGTGQIQTA